MTVLMYEIYLWVKMRRNQPTVENGGAWEKVCKLSEPKFETNS